VPCNRKKKREGIYGREYWSSCRIWLGEEKGFWKGGGERGKPATQKLKSTPYLRSSYAVKDDKKRMKSKWKRGADRRGDWEKSKQSSKKAREMEIKFC